MNNILKKSLKIAAASYLGACIYLYLTQSDKIYKTKVSKKTDNFKTSNNHKQTTQFIHTTSDNCQLERYECISHNPNAPWLIWFAGRGENINWMLNDIDKIPSFNVLLAQHRGFGKSSGVPTEDNLTNDAIDAINYIKQNYPNKPIIVGGRSLGSGVAIKAINQTHVDACILLTPYYCFNCLVKQKAPKIFPISTLLKTKFQSHKYLDNLNLPLLCILAQEDKLVPHQSSDKLFNAWSGNKEKIIIPETNHISVAHSSLFWQTLEKYAQKFIT